MIMSDMSQETRAGTRSFAAVALPIITSLMGVGATLLANKKQQEANEELWEKNNLYNTPENQARRLREGGFNPALSMANGSISSGASNSPAASVTPPSFESFGSTGADAMRLANETKLANSQYAINEQEAESGRIRNMFAMQEHAANLMEIASRIGMNTMQGRKLAREADFIYKQAQRYDEISDASIRYQNSQSRLASAEADLKELEAKFAPDQWQKILRNLDKQGDVLDSQVRANNSEAAYKSALEGLTKAQEEGVVMDNQLKEDVASAIVDQKFSEADEAYWKSINEGRTAHSYKFAGKEFSDMDNDSPFLQKYSRPSSSRKQSHVKMTRRK